MSSAARSEAVSYHRRGWCPIPIKRRSKQTNLLELAPYLTRRATNEELSSWTWPGVGIATGPVSGILVLDVDGPEGQAELKKRGHPVTPMVRTPSGGLHLYFKHPEADIRTGIRIAPGLDVKAGGGYVVAPPSLGTNGKSYEWIIGPDETELADPPDWLIRLLTRPQRNGKAPLVGDRIPPGRRNQELVSIGGTMRRRGLEEEEISAALKTINARRCDPPLEDSEVEKIACSVSRYEPAEDGSGIRTNGVRPTDEGAPRFNLTDAGNAARFADRHGANLRFVHLWNRWLFWDGKRWKIDECGEVVRLAKETVLAMLKEATSGEKIDKELVRHALRSESRQRIEAMIALAQSEPGIPVAPDQLDQDPWLLTVENGTLDLRTGELGDHRREDLITKLVPVAYDPEAEAPTWAAFLERVLPSESLRRFVQRAAGYSMTGDTRERILLLLYGIGRNGKTTLLEAIREALGDYALKTPAETLMAKPAGGIPNDVARLKGARFVSASETEANRRLAEALVKEITGSDTISARFMRAEWFDFKPTHQVWLATNHKPQITGTDPAIWDRIKLVPFEVRIPDDEVDKGLPDKLHSELPGIIAWAVRGCLEWRREGLGEPDEVTKATTAYKAEQDVLAAFIEECCVVKPSVWSTLKELYAAYAAWAGESNERAETKRSFGMRLTERGFEPAKGTDNVSIRRSIALRTDREPPDGGDKSNSNYSSSSTVIPENPWKTKDSTETITDNYSEPDITSKTISHIELCQDQSNDEYLSNSGSVDEPARKLTEEQARRVQKLIDQGMSPKWARAEVLGDGGA